MKDILGFEGLYAITKEGKVWSYPKEWGLSNIRTPRPGRWLNPRALPTGYWKVDLFKNGRRSNRYIHRLLAEAFIPNPSSFPTVNHKDGKKDNNALKNLEWCSISENNRHAYRMGLIKPHSQKGEAAPSAKLTEGQVREIRRLREEEKLTLQELGRGYCVSIRTIWDITTRKSWAHVA